MGRPDPLPKGLKSLSHWNQPSPASPIGMSFHWRNRNAPRTCICCSLVQSCLWQGVLVCFVIGLLASLLMLQVAAKSMKGIMFCGCMKACFSAVFHSQITKSQIQHYKSTERGNHNNSLSGRWQKDEQNTLGNRFTCSNILG